MPLEQLVFERHQSLVSAHITLPAATAEELTVNAG